MPNEEPRGAVLPRACGKVRHPDRATARAALAAARESADERRHRKTPRRIYPCGVCGGFHLTSQSKAQYLMWPGRGRASERSTS